MNERTMNDNQTATREMVPADVSESVEKPQKWIPGGLTCQNAEIGWYRACLGLRQSSKESVYRKGFADGMDCAQATAAVESRDHSPFIERLVAGLTERHSWYDFEAVAKVREVAAEMAKGK